MKTAIGVEHHYATVLPILLAGLGLVPEASRAATSDDFNACSVKSFWTVVDPLGGGGAQLTGMNTSDALLEIAVPAGASHDAWMTPNNTVRVMQPITDADFQVQVKFQSPFNAGTQLQGLLVQQDATHYLRYDVIYDGSQVIVFSATFSGTSYTIRANSTVAYSAPFWLDLKRVGNAWTEQYSTDGTTWQSAGSFSWTTAAAQVGIFAGNYADSGSAPAFTAKADYFQLASAPLTNEDAPLTGVTLTANVSGQGTVYIDPAKAVYYCGETVTLTATPAAGARFDHWSGHLSGSVSPQTLAMTQSRTVTAHFVGTGPAISNIQVTPFANRAVVTWSTDVPATSQVAYGTTTGYELGAVQDATLVTSHSATLNGLAPTTAHHAKITSQNATGDPSSSDDLPFTTLTAGALKSDDFNTCTLGPAWSVVNPLGDASVLTSGAGTGNAALEIALPAGPSHDPYSGNTGTRVMQPLGNSDFDMQAKFESVPADTYQMQGFLVEQSASKFLRFELYSSAGQLYLYASTLDGGVQDRGVQAVSLTAPVWLRLTRTADSWNCQYSTDGQNWTDFVGFSWAATLQSVGLYAGNFSTGTAPAFTMKADYFQVASDPLISEDTPFTSTALTTSVTGQGSISRDLPGPTYSCGETVTLTAVPAAGWKFDHWSGDLSGNTSPALISMTQSHTVAAVFVEESQPPAMQPDDFNGCTLKPFWTVVDPLGGGTATVSGMGTENALLEISVPAGAIHDAWIPNETVRVLQPAVNGDFEVQTKLQSTFTAGWQNQGLLVEQDPANYLRFDYGYDGSGYFLYSATFNGTQAAQRVFLPITATAPCWLSVARAGSTWTLRYSSDGQNWQTATTFDWTATLAKVGLFAGNFGSPGAAPAFTAKFDYFQLAASPIASEDGPLTGGTTLTTSVTGQGSITVNPAQSSYQCGEMVTLTAVSAAGWKFDHWGGDLSGSTSPATLSMAQSHTVTATFIEDSTPQVTQSDDFNICTLKPFWTVVDPLGGGTAIVTGMGTADALLEIGVPAGATHDAWIPNETVRVLQPAANGDFEVQTKLQSTFTAGWQTQGLLLEQDASNYLRFDYGYDGSGYFLYSATFNGTQAAQRMFQPITTTSPCWLSLARAGNTWTLRYAIDGNNWQTATTFDWTATVAKVGLFAGNFADSGAAPAFSAKFDYFQIAASPITSEDGPPAGGTTLSTSVTGQGSITVSPAQAAYHCGETVTVTAVPAAGWKFDSWGGDLSGNTSPATLSMAQSHTVSATFIEDATPPVTLSDDFNACALKPAWTLVDPLGGGTLKLTGTGTADALLEIGVPAGASHDAWAPNGAVRVVQPANNGDFEIRAKYQSAFDAGIQSQGLLVEQDAGTYLRFDVAFDGAQAFLYSATFVAGAGTQQLYQPVTYAAPFWLGVQRAGNAWTLRYSSDGQNWQTATSFSWTTTVAKVGVFAGNFSGSGAAPTFTAKVDYFEVAANPLASEDGPLTGGVTLTTSVTGQGSITRDLPGPTYYCGETLTLTAAPAAGWIFDHWTGDASGTQNPVTISMTADGNATAVFVAAP